jgi:large subunit ribosomal protein L6
MSRLAKKPIIIPQEVMVEIEPRNIKVSGPKGNLNFSKKIYIVFELNENQLSISSKIKGPKIRALLGTYVALTRNNIKGVTEGFIKELEFNGVGFRVTSNDPQSITLNLGFSHPIEFKAPDDIEIKVEKNIITISGIDKSIVGLTAAKIRDLKKPEPYKGKGIKYVDEVIRRKPGKAAATAVKSEGA